MELRVSIPGLEKLADYTASGIGSVAGTMLLPWRARKEVKARIISVQGETEAQRLLTEGRADAMNIIADAQAKVRAMLVSPDANVKGELDFADTVTQRIQFQEDKRQRNIESVVRQSASELECKQVEDHETDHDWTARFFNDIQDISTEEMQLLYAKILAGEVERPGSTSIRTMSILKDLDRTTATLFKILSSVRITSFTGDSEILDARVLSFGGNAAQNALQDFGLSFLNLNVLNEHGLIIADYDSWYDISTSISAFGINDNQEKVIARIPFLFQDRYWVLKPTKQRKVGAEYRVSGVALTKAGQELTNVVDHQPVSGYIQKVEAFFSSQDMVMTEVDNGLPHIVDTDGP